MSFVSNGGGDARLRELDGWRGVSVVLVILHHIFWYQYPELTKHLPGFGRIVRYSGPLGVKVFFVISGFVICRLLILEQRRYGAISLKAFYYRRIFRILPPLYVYIAALSFLLCMGVIRDHARAILGGLLFLYDVKVPFGSWFVGHTWSLAVEEQFYLIFPALFVLTRELWRTRVFVGIFCLLVVWRISMVYTGDAGLVYGETRTGFACIACGVLMAIHEKRVRRIAAAFPGFIVALLAVILLVHPVTDMSWESALYESLLVPPSVGLILAFSLECGPRLRAFLCCKPVQAVGVTSYGIYLWQQLFTAPGEYFLGWGELIPKLFPLLAVVVPASYFLIEKPAMRRGKTISQRVRDESVPRIAVS